MNKSFLFTLIVSYLVLPLLIAYIFISYIKSLESKDKKCSEDVRRKYVKYYGYAFIILAFCGIITLIFSMSIPRMALVDTILKVSALLINFLAAFVLYQYSDLLESGDCECSKSWKRAFIKYYGYFLIIVVGLIFFSLLFTFILHIFNEEDQYIIEMRKILRGCIV